MARVKLSWWPFVAWAFALNGLWWVTVGTVVLFLLLEASKTWADTRRAQRWELCSFWGGLWTYGPVDPPPRQVNARASWSGYG